MGICSEGDQIYIVHRIAEVTNGAGSHPPHESKPCQSPWRRPWAGPPTGTRLVSGADMDLEKALSWVALTGAILLRVSL